MITKTSGQTSVHKIERNPPKNIIVDKIATFPPQWCHRLLSLL